MLERPLRRDCSKLHSFENLTETGGLRRRGVAPDVAAGMACEIFGDYHTCFPHSISWRTCFLMTLPPGFRGNAAVRRTMYCGTLKSASWVRAKARISEIAGFCPGFGTITAPTFSPIMLSGTAVTATSKTAGCAA